MTHNSDDARAHPREERGQAGEGFTFEQPQRNRMHDVLRRLGHAAIQSQKITDHEAANAAQRQCLGEIEALVREVLAGPAPAGWSWDEVGTRLRNCSIHSIAGGEPERYLIKIGCPDIQTMQAVRDGMVHLREGTAAPQPAGAERVDLAAQPEAVEMMAEHLHEEHKYDHQWVWPTHADDDGYRGGGYVTITPPDIQAEMREMARRVLVRAAQIPSRLHLVPASLPAALGRGEGTAGASSGFDPSRGFAEIAAKQATLGLGLVDIAIIRHEGKAGVLFIPRADHIEFGEGGRIQAGDYWPTANDIVLWVDGEGPGVAISYLSQLTPAPYDGSGAAGETEWLDPKGGQEKGLAARTGGGPKQAFRWVKA